MVFFYFLLENYRLTLLSEYTDILKNLDGRAIPAVLIALNCESLRAHRLHGRLVVFRKEDSELICLL